MKPAISGISMALLLLATSPAHADFQYMEENIVPREAPRQPKSPHVSPPAILSFTAAAGPESMGNMAVQLKWQVSNAESVRLFRGKNLVKIAKGETSATVDQEDPDIAYRLEATNKGGTVSEVIAKVTPGSLGPAGAQN